MSRNKIISFQEKNKNTLFQSLTIPSSLADIQKTILEKIESGEKFKKLPKEKQKEARVLFQEVITSLPYFDRMVALANLLVHETMKSDTPPEKVTQELQKMDPALKDFYILNQRLEKEPICRGKFQDLITKLPEKEQKEFIKKLMVPQGSLIEILQQAESDYAYFIPAIQDAVLVKQPLMQLSKYIQFNNYDNANLLLSDGRQIPLKPVTKAKVEKEQLLINGGAATAFTGSGAMLSSLAFLSSSNPLTAALFWGGVLLYSIGFGIITAGLVLATNTKFAEKKMLNDTDLTPSAKDRYMALMGNRGTDTERKNNPGDLRILMYSHQQALKLIPKTQKEIRQKLKILSNRLKKASPENVKDIQAQIHTLQQRLLELTQEKQKRKALLSDLKNQYRSILRSVKYLIYQPKKLTKPEIEFLGHLLDPIYVAKRIAFHKLYHSKKNMNGVTAYLKQKQLMGADVETEIYKLGHIFQRNYQKPKTLTAEEKRVLLTTGI